MECIWRATIVHTVGATCVSPAENAVHFLIFRWKITFDRLTAMHFCFTKVRTSSDQASLGHLPQRGRHFEFQSSRRDTSIRPKGIFHIASAIFHISAGNISLSLRENFIIKMLCCNFATEHLNFSATSNNTGDGLRPLCCSFIILLP